MAIRLARKRVCEKAPSIAEVRFASLGCTLGRPRRRDIVPLRSPQACMYILLASRDGDAATVEKLLASYSARLRRATLAYKDNVRRAPFPSLRLGEMLIFPTAAQDGRTALYEATKRNHVHVMRLLIEHGAKLEVRTSVRRKL